MMEPNNPLTLTARLRQGWSYLPFLLGPMGIAAAVVYYRVLLQQYPDDPGAVGFGLNAWATFLETIAPWLLTAATAIYWGKAIYTRNPTYVILTVLSACLLLRELHWDHMIKVAIFPLLGICFVWLFLWRDVVDKPTHNWRHTLFFFAALATYGLSQMVEKHDSARFPDAAYAVRGSHRMLRPRAAAVCSCVRQLATENPQCEINSTNEFSTDYTDRRKITWIFNRK